MADYQIITDSGCDLSTGLLENMDVKKVPLSVLFRGETRADSVDEGIKDFYDGLRAGDIATTAAVNPEGWKTVIEPAFRAGQDALVLAFSSGLSTTYQSAVIAAQELMEQYPEFKPMYETLYQICQNTERVMGFFSEELRILDRNTVKYMI